jgi:hypothetical protein
MEALTSKVIENKIFENYIEYANLFTEFQSKFLEGLFSRYQSIENGNLVLYYAKETHQDILRQKDFNLSFNLGLEKFWENHSKIKLDKKPLIKIADDTFLPKETVRRKILQLTKQNVINKVNKRICWAPNELYKQNYNLFIEKEIQDVVKLISFVCKKLNYSISSEELTREIKDKFSFYWFHYLDVQLNYLKIWTKQLKDLELLFISIQVASLFNLKAKKKNLSHKNINNNPGLIKDLISASVSATSISEVTDIPRATCIRKLETLVKMKMISQDKISKRYYLIPESITENVISKKVTINVIKIFSDFFFICIRAISLKT